MAVNSVGATTTLQDHRIREIFREFDALSAGIPAQDDRLRDIEAQLTEILALLRPAGTPALTDSDQLRAANRAATASPKAR